MAAKQSYRNVPMQAQKVQAQHLAGFGLARRTKMDRDAWILASLTIRNVLCPNPAQVAIIIDETAQTLCIRNATMGAPGTCDVAYFAPDGKLYASMMLRTVETHRTGKNRTPQDGVRCVHPVRYPGANLLQQVRFARVIFGSRTTGYDPRAN